jgi:cytochrome c5
MKINSKTLQGTAAVTLLVAVLVTGCAISGRTNDSFGEARAVPASSAQAADLSGSQLWGQMCGLCHNAPSPKDYSDGQWEVAVRHMRVQARLTGEEERKIVQFLKASN